MSQDESHLRLLAVFHYVLAAGWAIFSSVFLFQFLWGIAILRGVPFFGPPEKDAPPGLGVIMMAMGGGAVLLGWTGAALLIVAGRSLTQHRRYLFCLIVAGIVCVMCNPLGTLLGVFTIIILMRPSVKQMFGDSI